MGQVNTEQAVKIIDAVSNAVEKSQPEPNNYWWWLSLGIIPVFVGWLLNNYKKKGK